MILVVDASFAAKVLLREEGTTVAQRWWQDEEADWLAPALIAAEVEAALAVHHRVHPERFDAAARRAASSTWRRMLEAIGLHVIDRTVATDAIAMIQRDAPLRGADASYLAVAGRLHRQAPGQVVVGSFDRHQRRAAATAGLPLAPQETDTP